VTASAGFIDYTYCMSRTIAIANQKGGVGKTTTSVNLAAALGSMHKRVLLIDLDPQGNATMGCGIDKFDTEQSILDVLVEDVPVATVKQTSETNGCDVLPANADLTAAEVELMRMDAREQRLKQALASESPGYDYVLIDCPPSLNILTLNAFVAADSVLVPIQCEYYALEGLSALLETIEGVREAVNPTLAIEGLLRTMYDSRNNLGVEVSGQLVEHFGEQVFRTIIPRNVRLAEAPSYGVSIVQYDKSSRGALAYLALAGEIIRNQARLQARLQAQLPEQVPTQATPQPQEQDEAQQQSQAAVKPGAMSASGTSATEPAPAAPSTSAATELANEIDPGVGTQPPTAPTSDTSVTEPVNG